MLSDDKTVNDSPAHICKFTIQLEWKKNNVGLKYAYFISDDWETIHIYIKQYYNGTIDNNIII